ncbi:hypothetical protein BDC45DRAFT_529416 [Circinella umbellata]|nr:hypothetical protein BDC45DRAFT_529416 [Circinella umbellata]
MSNYFSFFSPLLNLLGDHGGDRWNIRNVICERDLRKVVQVPKPTTFFTPRPALPFFPTKKIVFFAYTNKYPNRIKESFVLPRNKPKIKTWVKLRFFAFLITQVASMNPLQSILPLVSVVCAADSRLLIITQVIFDGLTAIRSACVSRSFCYVMNHVVRSATVSTPRSMTAVMNHVVNSTTVSTPRSMTVVMNHIKEKIVNERLGMMLWLLIMRQMRTELIIHQLCLEDCEALITFNIDIPDVSWHPTQGKETIKGSLSNSDILNVCHQQSVVRITPNPDRTEIPPYNSPLLKTILKKSLAHREASLDNMQKATKVFLLNTSIFKFRFNLANDLVDHDINIKIEFSCLCG